MVANKMEAALRGNSDADWVALASGTIEKPTMAAKTQADRVIETSKGQKRRRPGHTQSTTAGVSFGPARPIGRRATPAG